MNLPACVGSTGTGVCGNTQQEQRHARPFRRQHQFPAGGEVEAFGCPPAFHQQGPQPRTARGFRRRMKQGHLVRHNGEQQGYRI